MLEKFEEKTIVLMVNGKGLTYQEDVWSKNDLVILGFEELSKFMGVPYSKEMSLKQIDQNLASGSWTDAKLWRVPSEQELLKGFCTQRYCSRTPIENLKVTDFSQKQYAAFKSLIRKKVDFLRQIIKKEQTAN